MALELEGKIITKLPVQNGTSARGPWSKQEFVIEYQEGNYPTQVCMNVWGEDKVKELEKFQAGESVKVSFNLSSREYNGRWYSDIRALSTREGRSRRRKLRLMELRATRHQPAQALRSSLPRRRQSRRILTRQRARTTSHSNGTD